MTKNSKSSVKTNINLEKQKLINSINSVVDIAIKNFEIKYNTLINEAGPLAIDIKIVKLNEMDDVIEPSNQNYSEDYSEDYNQDYFEDYSNEYSNISSTSNNYTNPFLNNYYDFSKIKKLKNTYKAYITLLKSGNQEDLNNFYILYIKNITSLYQRKKVLLEVLEDSDNNDFNNNDSYKFILLKLREIDTEIKIKEQLKHK